jgi:hypothetical protein
MQRAKNNLGKCYDEGSKAQQMMFRAELLAAADRDGFNYWKPYRETWQYEETAGRIPFVIVQAAIDKLGYNPALPSTATTMLSTLKMQTAA